jgi:hypothetical protein
LAGLISVIEDYVARTEVLNEIVFNVQDCLSAEGVPFCAFNSGRDVWVDVGQKASALQSLQEMLSLTPAQSLHIGDQMTMAGNDFKTRDSACTLWVSSPRETQYLLELMFDRRENPSPAPAASAKKRKLLD